MTTRPHRRRGSDKAEHALSEAIRRAELQRRSLPAVNHGTPWTPDDDHELVMGDGTLLQRARRLGRTYVGAERRLSALRDKGGDQL